MHFSLANLDLDSLSVAKENSEELLKLWPLLYTVIIKKGFDI